MALAIALVAVVAATVLFHVFSPWWATPLASNWQQMDDTLTITLIITGAFFIVINLWVGYGLALSPPQRAACGLRTENPASSAG